jgi:hypothetical protein
MNFGSATITYPASGTGTGGGGGGAGGGGYTCVWENAWVQTKRGPVRARDVVPGDFVLILNTETMEDVAWEEVTHNTPATVEGWEIATKDGRAKLHLSSQTPLTLRDNTAIFPCQLAGEELPVMIDGVLSWQPCYAQPLPEQLDVAHISCSSQNYAAGNDPEAMILTHNIKP